MKINASENNDELDKSEVCCSATEDSSKLDTMVNELEKYEVRERSNSSVVA